MNINLNTHEIARIRDSVWSNVELKTGIKGLTLVLNPDCDIVLVVIVMVTDDNLTIDKEEREIVAYVALEKVVVKFKHDGYFVNNEDELKQAVKNKIIFKNGKRFYGEKGEVSTDTNCTCQ